MLRLAFLLLLILATPVAAAKPAPPQVVVDAAMELYFDYDYSDPENAWAPRPAPDQLQHFLKKKVIRPVSFSGKKAADWVIDVEAEPTVAWCGTGGCTLQIWTPETDGTYRKVFDQQVREWKLKAISGERRRWLWVDLHGTACGSFGADACPFGFEWARDGYVRGSSRFATKPVMRSGPLPQAMDDLDTRQAPPALLDLAAKQQSACVTAGGDLNGAFAIVNRAPDLNGDGIGDWSFDYALSYCTFPDDPDFKKAEAFDDCSVLDCVNALFVSKTSSQGNEWQRIDLGKSEYAFRIHSGGFEAFEVETEPVRETDEPPCRGGELPYCQITPLAPKLGIQ